MKKLLLILFLGFALVGFSQNTDIPYPNFERALIELALDSGQVDGKVLTANISGVTTLDVSNKNISNLTGIEGFTALTSLKFGDNQLTELNVTSNSALTVLWCHSNSLEELNVTGILS